MRISGLGHWDLRGITCYSSHGTRAGGERVRELDASTSRRLGRCSADRERVDQVAPQLAGSCGGVAEAGIDTATQLRCRRRTG